MNYKAIFKSIKETNGAYYNTHTKELNPIAGYMIPLLGYDRNYRIPDSYNELSNIIHDYITHKPVWDEINAYPLELFVGFWINNNRLIIDLSQNVIDRETAMAYGLERNQIAIYDCLNKADIKIPILSDYDER